MILHSINAAVIFAEAIAGSLQHMWSGHRLLEHISLATVGVIHAQEKAAFLIHLNLISSTWSHQDLLVSLWQAQCDKKFETILS